MHGTAHTADDFSDGFEAMFGNRIGSYGLWPACLPHLPHATFIHMVFKGQILQNESQY
jgi:hypothetical protein